MPDLTTNYLGLQLRNPVVASAGPISQSVTGIRSLADAGVGAVVMYSLFEEQVRREAERVEEMARQHEAFPEATSFLPDLPEDDPDGTTAYLKLVEVAAQNIDVPLIASLNGATPGSWTSMARSLESAGAAALELNIYFVPGDMTLTSNDVERRHIEIVQAVKETVRIPVAVKLSPYFSSLGHFALALDDVGADGLVLFNRFLQPDIDIDRMEVRSGVTLSSPIDARLPRTWIAVLRGHVKASLAATSGVDDFTDVVKYILAGADVVMTTSALVRHGVAHAEKLVNGLGGWLGRKGMSLDAARGMLAVPAGVEPDAHQRAGYVAALTKAKETYGSLH